jgi:hypothetical protein
MAYNQQDMSGVLFKNTKKTNEKQPDYTGNIQIGTEELKLAAWIKEGKNGKFLSIKASEQTSAPKESKNTDGDDMPF